MKNYKQIIVDNITSLDDGLIKFSEEDFNAMCKSFIIEEQDIAAHLLLESAYKNIKTKTEETNFPSVVSLDEAFVVHFEYLIDEYKKILQKELEPKESIKSILIKFKRYFYNLNFWRNSAKERAKKMKLNKELMKKYESKSK